MTDETLRAELLPCPFCGSDKVTAGKSFVSCDSCGADGAPAMTGWNPGKTPIELWNTRQAGRASAAVSADFVDALREWLDAQSDESSNCDVRNMLAYGRLTEQASAFLAAQPETDR